MSKELSKIYNNYVRNKLIDYDEKQLELLTQIYKVWKKSTKFNFLMKSPKQHGIYISGSVGIGKTFILNLFIQNLQKSKKYHFNHFMINIHSFINNNYNDKSRALEEYIKKIGKKYDVLFIDELHIFNIVDALLVKKIFILFKKYKIFILISSNFEPTELYKDGLQRSDFLPFIIFLKENFNLFKINKIQDYRRKMLNQSKTYFTPINTQTIKEFNHLFEKFVDKSQIYIRRVYSKSRIIRFEKCTSNIVFCKFEELCLKNYAHEDYINIAKVFSLIFISNIPKFTSSESDQCRRFISLIDMLYDYKCSVVILAEKPINQLCEINNLIKEFERTASRLYEMTIIKTEI